MFYFHSQFSDLKNKITSQIASLFPRKGKLNTLRLKRIWVEDKLQADDYSAQKDARLKERTWAVPVYGDFELVNNATGKVIDTQDRVRLALMPKMTSRGSFVVNGSEYQVSNMLRLKPGVYTVIQANGVLDSWVNLAKGKNFNVMLDPKTGIFTIKVGTANVKLYPLLIAMGANASDIKSAWGAELADQNASKGDYDTEILKAHKAFIGKPVANVATAIADLTAYFGKTELSPEVTKTTLGQSFSGASADLLLATSKKILSVSRGQGKTDDRDALEFKTVHSVEDLLPERIAKTSQALARSIDRNIDRKNLVRHIISADTFGMPIETFFTGSDEFAGLAQVTPQTNPLSMLGETNKTTTLGPGGIGSVHSITLESRAVNPTSFAFLDPIQSPEGEKVGTTMHIATAARKVGNSLVIRVIDAKTGKLHDLNAIEASRVIIAFSDQYVRRGKKMVANSAIVKAVRGGEFVNAPRSQVDYIFPSAKGFFSFAANMVPFLHSDQGNRAMMASKMIEQALPLKYREAPMVETQLSSGTTFGSMLGEAYSVRSPAEGRISKITKDAIVVKDARGKSHTVNVPSKLPLNSHVYLDADPLVKVGDKVKSGQLLADSNFTKDGKMALGTGLRTAFIPYRGLNFEDAVVISDSAAKKLTSLHMHQESVDVDQGVVLSLKKFKAYYPGILDAEATKKLDDDGVVRVGQKVKAGDVLIAALREEHMGPESDMLRKLHRSFVQPYRNAAVTWAYEDEGTVTDVAKSGKRVTVYVTTEEPAKVGSKLSNRHGAKGIVSAIIPDAQMPHSADGRPVQMIANPNGIIGRINLGQMLETAAGKIAERDGKPFIVDNFSGENYVAKIKKELKARGLSDKEDIFDPGLNKTIPHVLVGNQYVMQLDHPVRKKFSARSTGGYTMDMQPPQGGGQGGQGIGKMEFAALVAHNVPHLIQEAATVRGHKNDEYWRMLQAGMPLPAPETPFSFQKLETMIKGMGVDVRKEGHELELSPMTDAQILKQSNGEIKDALAVRAKDLRPEKGGIFDPESTGGVGGRHYNHVSLSEATPNPIFEMAIRELLGLTEKDYREYVDGHKWIHKDGSAATKDSRGAITGGEAIKALLGKIDVDKTLAELRRTAKNMRGADLEKANRKMRYLSALKEKSLSPTVYVLDNFPVIPAMFRPVYQLPNGNLGISQINELYRDTILVNNQLGDKKLPDDLKANLRKDLYDGLKGIVGLGTSLSGRKRKGFIEQISGDSPKTGYFQSRVMGRRQDLSGRSTIVPGPNLGLDEVAIPEQMAWKLYEPFVIRELGTMGYTPLQAKEHLEQKDELARKALEVVASDRPVFLNRAPTLHKFSIMAFKPKLVSGQAIKMNPLVVQGFNADHDGDQQFNSVLLLANEAAMAIISGSASFGRRWLEDRIVTARFKVELPLLNERDEILMVHLEDFPHGDVLYSKEGRNGPIEFYSVPAGIKVLAHDASTGEVAWRDVTVWSVHRDRRVEIVNLSSGRQIITDDDPRAVYGVDRGSLSLVRRTPQDALDHKMLVPRIDRIGCGRDTVAQLNTAEANNRNTDIKLVNPMPVDRKLGYVIGSVCGDGWVADGKNGPKDVCLAGISDEVQDRFYECLRSLYVSAAPEPCVQHSPDSMGPSRKYTYTSACLANFLAPLVGRKAHGKHLPPWFLGACREFREGLFAGLMDTDGTVSVSNGKAKPQLQCTYTSVSLRLVQEVKFLAASLGVRGRISRSRTPAGADFWVLAFSTVDFKKCGDTGMCHSEKLVRMQSTAVADNSPSACASDVVPISRDLAEAMQLAMGAPRNRSKEMTSLYQIALKAKDSGKITRKSAQALMAKLSSFSHPDYERWSCIVNDTQVCWDEVESVEKTDCRETGYDLTVPGFETFMSVDGVILSNTLAVHVPISEEARREAIGMLPSNNLFSPRDGSLMNLPSQEAVLGLYLATSDSKKTNAKFKSTRDAIRAYITGKHDLADEVSVGGRRMTIGQAAINEVLPAEYRERDLVVTKKKLASLLNSLAKQKPQVFADVVSKLKDIGNEHAYRSGFSVGLEDLTVNTGARDRIFAEADRKAKKVGVTAAYSEATKKLEDELKRELIAKKNPFYQMVVSGARGNMSQLRQILGAPVLVKDMNDQPIPVPIKKSFAEGLSIADYLATLPGARKGILDKSLMTSKPGAFSKELVSAAISQRVSMADCGTHNGKSLATDDPDALDHYLAKGVGRRAHRNQLVTPALVSKLKGRVKTIVVRTPATCEAPNGVCQMCYGLDEHGHKVDVGRNVGVLAAQTVSEPLTQMSVSGEERCLVMMRGEIKWLAIGELIDKLFDQSRDIENIDNTWWTKVNDVAVPSLKADGSLSWLPVSDVSRHLSPETLLRVTTRSGYQVTATDHHSFVMLDRFKLIKAKGSELHIGDRLPIARHLQRSATLKDVAIVDYVSAEKIGAAKKKLPLRLPLNREMGWIIGAFLSEGTSTYSSSMFSNTDRSFLRAVRAFADSLGLNCYEAVGVRKGGFGGKYKDRSYASGTCNISSTVLAKFIRESCGSNSYTKRLPAFAFAAPEEFICGLVSGFVDGDGSLSLDRSILRMSSVNRKLLNDFQIILSLVGVQGAVRENGPCPCLELRIDAKLKSLLGLCTAKKGSILKGCAIKKDPSYQEVDMIPAIGTILLDISKKLKLPSRYVNSAIRRQRIGRLALMRHIERFETRAQAIGVDVAEDLKILRDWVSSGVMWDEIVSIERIPAPTSYVYDFSVPGTENFMCNGVIVSNTLKTFHTGSVAEAGKPSVVGGFTRVKEILEMNEIVKGKAALAEHTGKVQSIRNAPAGGEIVTIAGREHFVDPGRTVVVKVGDHVSKGDRLSDGSIKPQELLDLKGVAAVRDYLTGELKKEYASQGIKVKAKIFDTVIRPLVNAAQVTDPGSSKYLPGDVTTLSAIQSFNRGKPDNEHIKFEPKLKGVNTYPLMSHDWLERLNYQQLAKTLTQGPAQGWKANILNSPVGAYATGTLMGREKRAEALEIEPEAPEGVALEDLEIPEIMAELNNA